MFKLFKVKDFEDENIHASLKKVLETPGIINDDLVRELLTYIDHRYIPVSKETSAIRVEGIL